MRLIDADALNIRKYTRWFEDPADERQVERMIREAPTIDAVPVVRGECKHYNKTCCSKGFGWCENADRGVCDDFYCADGRRLEVEGKVNE